MSDLNHEITGCPKCDAEAHEKAQQERDSNGPGPKVGAVVTVLVIAMVLLYRAFH
ncbi:hypothetical protein ACIQU6_39835 [Streptomyces sp. NPDC090442]|uniref:hypothetical protein n=1 Tax=Streptomyces sp. NPDC090442 TaxID=3365962 RepID=UPI00381F0698